MNPRGIGLQSNVNIPDRRQFVEIDDAGLRDILGLRPAPEFEMWMVDLGLMKDGVLTAQAGDPSFFLKR